jgi:L-aminopeptidase/D-esterase-like protein
MITYGFKGGTGTASRVVPLGGKDYTIGTLVQANHGQRDWLTICGVPVGKHLQDNTPQSQLKERGSIIVVIATDLPMAPHQLKRLARRAAIGIGRNGTPGGNNSGDIFLAFSTANPQPMTNISTRFMWRRWIAWKRQWSMQCWQRRIVVVLRTTVSASMRSTTISSWPSCSNTAGAVKRRLLLYLHPFSWPCHPA